MQERSTLASSIWASVRARTCPLGLRTLPPPSNHRFQPTASSLGLHFVFCIAPSLSSPVSSLRSATSLLLFVDMPSCPALPCLPYALYACHACGASDMSFDVCLDMLAKPNSCLFFSVSGRLSLRACLFCRRAFCRHHCRNTHARTHPALRVYNAHHIDCSRRA